jgi:hypothetical protein
VGSGPVVTGGSGQGPRGAGVEVSAGGEGADSGGGARPVGGGGTLVRREFGGKTFNADLRKGGIEDRIDERAKQIIG